MECLLFSCPVLLFHLILAAREIQGCEVIVQSFGAAYEFDRSVLLQKKLSASELSVVVEAHSVTVCTCIMDYYAVSDGDFRKPAVYGEFIIVLAERACYIIYMVTDSILFSDNGDVMICTVECRAHEVCHAGVETDVVLVGFLFVEHGGHQPAVRACNSTA